MWPGRRRSARIHRLDSGVIVSGLWGLRWGQGGVVQSMCTGCEAVVLDHRVAWSVPQREFADHFALVKHMLSEAPQLPHGVVEAWDQAGPQRAVGALAREMRALSDRGLLSLHDPAMAAEHFLLLTVGAVDACGNGGVRSS